MHYVVLPCGYLWSERARRMDASEEEDAGQEDEDAGR